MKVALMPTPPPAARVAAEPAHPGAAPRKDPLVNGAAGGVGHVVVQIARGKGAHVIAVASGKNQASLRHLGAVPFIDYRKSSPEDVVRDADLVLDCVGGPTTGRVQRTLKPGGALFPAFPLGFAGGDEAERLGVTVSTTQVRSSGAQLRQVRRLLDDAAIRVVIDSTFPLADARGAHERAAQGRIHGKIVLTVD
jgi:NADPH:quinone reductase-like Zn-dependent oxidoreductase